MGVKVNLKCLTDDYDGETATLSTGEKIKTNTLIWAAGVKGNTLDGFHKDSYKKSKILVDGYNNVYKNPIIKNTYKNIFAIGDMALMKNEKYPKGLPGLAQPAIQQGKQVAQNLNRIMKNKEINEFSYKNKGVLATVGRNKAVADFSGDIHLGGFVGWFIWMVVHLLFLVGFRNKAVVFANWMWNYFTYDRGIRLILRPSSKGNDKITNEMVNAMRKG